jgi:hypothetical protein
MKKSIILSLAITLLASTVFVSNSFGGPIKGAGALPCGRWVAQREANEHDMALAWVMGFMSSFNHYIERSSKKSGVFEEIDHYSIALWMDKYCRNNPLKSVYKGSTVLIEEMNKK